MAFANVINHGSQALLVSRRMVVCAYTFVLFCRTCMCLCTGL